jgi:hypothetical protein
MTGYLWTAVALSLGLAFTTFCVVLGLARRVRLLAERVAALGPPPGLDLPESGTAVPDFVVPTTDGGEVRTDDLAGGDVLVLFLTADCRSCLDEAARLREQAGDGGVGLRPIAVVIGEPDERAGLVSQLEPVARVVEETHHTGLAARFGVNGFPAIMVVGGGVIRSAGHRIDDVRLGIPA